MEKRWLDARLDKVDVVDSKPSHVVCPSRF